MKILVTVPQLQKGGGVAGYFSALESRFSPRVEYFVRGARGGERGKFLRVFRDYLAFSRRIARREVRLVHINTSLAAGGVFRDALLIVLAKVFRKRVLLFFRGWHPGFQAKLERRGLWLFRQVFFRSDAFVVLAAEFEGELRRWGYRGPVFRETTAFDDALLAEGHGKEGYAPAGDRKPFTLLFLARVEKEKGIYELLEAFVLLREENANVRLVVAGDGSELARVKTFVRDRKLAGVEFRGFVRGEDKRKAFIEADVYVFPSRHGEGMPNSVLEAMAFGLPIIAPPVGGLRDFLADGKTGLLIENGHPRTIASKVERLIADSRLRQEIGGFNAQYAATHFSSSAVARRLEKIYDRLFEGTAGNASWEDREETAAVAAES